MSHRATIWAIEQRGLKPATKIVLWHLADRHNPDHGCFPSQERLAEDCEMSRSTLNEHLNKLEAIGLIRRDRRQHGKTKKRLTTRYLLAFEEEFGAAATDRPASAPVKAAEKRRANGSASRPEAATSEQAAHQESKPCPESGHGFEDEPSPENPESHVRKMPKAMSGRPDTEPVREPVREPCAGGADAAQVRRALDEFWMTFPRLRNRDRCAKLLAAALTEGVDPAWIMRSAERYRAENMGNKPMYVAYADNWLDGRRWEDYEDDTAEAPGQLGKTERIARFWADKVRAGRYVPPTAISAEVAAYMIDKGMLQERDLLRNGVRL